ncbi:glycosyltransferase family 39 protein [Sphaerotilus sp.]|uniref:glycosyltransferase family 39 protein n=1 Tax=Sphaerotilus sp. TaxID=2093942 RepID=UPI0034E2E00C
MDGTRVGGLAVGAGRQPIPWLPDGGLPLAWSGRWLAHPPLLAAVLVFAWVLVAWLTNTAQYGDHFEQLSWAQSMEWGYHKHPPLPSWMLAVAIRVGGLHAWWPSALAGGCIALNLVLTWRIACWLIGEDRAGLAVLFAGLQQGFMGKAQLFNHNSVLVVCVSAVVLLALRATQLEAARPARRQTGRWVLVGVMAGLAMLSKYQAALPLIGVVVAMWRTGALARPANRQGLALAVALALLMLAPHVAWVATHGWSTVAYATQSGVSQSAGERLAGVTKFLVIQLRVLSPALLMLALVAGWSGRRSMGTAVPCTAPVAREGRPTPQWVWLTSLLGVPVAGVLVAALMGGLRLQDHWGIQTFQFMGLVAAALWPRRVQPEWRRWVTVALVLHGVFALAYTAPRWTDLARSPRTRVDEFYPARAMADAMRAQWVAAVPAGCALRYVRGPGFEAGIIGLYTPEHPAVVDDNLLHTPWLQLADFAEAGHLAVRLGSPPELDEWSSGPVLRGVFSFDVPTQRNEPHQTLHWMIVPPARCAAP